MTKKTKILVSVAVVFVAIIGVSIGVYNHFKLWEFKGVKMAYLQNYFENPKCDFNPLVIQSTNSANLNGGGRIQIAQIKTCDKISSLTQGARLSIRAQFSLIQTPKKHCCRA